MPLTVGTAGHIDHGKTWLVRALTGKDTDRLPEEKARGISIELGYAPLELPDGRQLSLVDVPGHERFVRTMVAGATGIDLFLLVVDAGEGARPQTHEHLAVLRLLGVERGVVAVTKADAFDPAPAIEEARELVPKAEIVAVSAKTGLGLEELRAALGRAAVASRPADAPTRLYVDRVFTLRGIGTVATGTLWSGSIGEGDELRAEPAGLDVRVRSVQVHDRAVERAEAGQRVAVALPRVERHQLRRGDALIARGAYPVSYRLDVQLTELAPVPPAVTVHHGTAAIPARVVTKDGLTQLRLHEPVVAAAGDCLVLRTSTTVAGGVVLDPAPPRRRDTVEEDLVGELTARLDAADPLDPGVQAEPRWEEAAARLGLERRGGKLYRPGAAPSLGERAAEADALLAALAGLEPVAMEADLARYLEREGKVVRLGGGLVVAREEYVRACALVAEEAERTGSITLARFRDLAAISRRPAQLLLERMDVDGITRRVGDERVLRGRPRRASRS
ncbi:MAG: selenocysteine-specific translation elongation factor [Gaiellaceae bacterium]